MISLMFHGRTIGYICQRIATHSKGKIVALSDSSPLPPKIEGTLIRWDSKVRLAADRTINTAEAVALSRNKRDTRLKLTGLCPPTWTSWLHQRKEYTYPCLVRTKRHFAAQGFYVCQNLKEVEAALKKCGYQHWYISPIIKKVQEYRVFVFQGCCLKVVRRYHDDPTQVAWNIANGGKSKRLKRESWPIPIVKAAIAAGQRINLGWYAADVIVDAEGRPYVLELNTAPGLERDETIVALAKTCKWAGQNEPPPQAVGETWLDLIHPAVKERIKEEED